MAIDKAAHLARIQVFAKSNPPLYDVLRALVNEQVGLEAEVSVLSTIGSRIVTVPDLDVSFGYTVDRTGIDLYWTIKTTYYYELRYGEDWDSATRIAVTPANIHRVLPLTIGTHKFLLRDVNQEGGYGANIEEINIIIPNLGPFVVEPKVLNNNVFLTWTKPESIFDIHNYIVSRDGVEIGTSESLFHALFELSGGTYTYSVTPVDIAGNRGETVSLEVMLTPPSDYQFDDTMIDLLDVPNTNRTLVNADISERRVRLPIVIETWNQHFEKLSYDTIQEFVDNGYGAWLEPYGTEGSYTYRFDFGSVHDNRFVRSDFDYIGDITRRLEIRASEDAVTWTDWAVASNNFFDKLRYIELRLSVSGDGTKLLIAYNLRVVIEALTGSDQGSIEVEAVVGTITAESGTLVNTHIDFTSFDSIIVQPIDYLLRHAVVTDITLPDSFRVILYDDQGDSVSGTVNWAVRGKV